MNNLPAGLTKAEVVALFAAIVPGTVFSTPFESGCIAITAPDDLGNFDGKDSEGVICNFGIYVGGMPLTIAEGI